MGDWQEALLWKESRGKAVLRPVCANAVTILGNDERWADVLAWDDFGGCIVTQRTPPWHPDDAPADVRAGDWADEDTTRAGSWLAREYALDLGARLVHEAVAVVAQRRRVHPVRDWLRTLEWDRTPRLDTWLVDCAGVKDTPYARAVSRIFLIGAVARAFVPGAKVDTLPVFEGPQGTFKSTMLRELAGEAWFLETGSELGTKDSYQQLRRKWIVELGELASLARGDIERIKAFISARVDTYRQSYGRATRDFARQCVFAATVNPAGGYLKDPTGARRFMPVRCGVVDVGRLRDMREQLWAEARVRYEAHEPWHVEGHELASLFASEQEARFQVDPWEQLIGEWISSKSHPQRRADGVTTRDVLELCLGIEKSRWTRSEEMRVAAILRRLGWEPPEHPIVRDGVRVRPYRPKAVQLVPQVVQGPTDENHGRMDTPAQPAHADARAYVRTQADTPSAITETGWLCCEVVQDHGDPTFADYVAAQGIGGAQ